MNGSAWRYYTQFFRSHSRKLVLSIVISIGQSLLVLPITLLIRNAFDDLIPSGHFSFLALTGVVIVLLYLTEGGATLWTRHIILETTKTIIQQFREELLRMCYTFSRSYYTKADQIRLHTMLVQDTERVDIMTNAVLAQFLPSLFISFVLCALLAYLNWLLFLIIVGTVVVLVVLNKSIGGESKKRVYAFHRSFERFSKGMMFVLHMMDLTRIQSAENFETERQRKHFADLRRTSRRMAWYKAAYVLAQRSTVAICAVVILIVGGYAVVKGNMTLGELLSFYAALALLKPRLHILSFSLPQIIEGNESLSTLYGILKTDHPRPYTGTQRIPFTGKISLDAVSFGYSDDPCLHGITFEIHPGNVIALFGPNGSGKTTIANLILGFYRPQRGQLFADNLPYDDVDIVNLRLQIGVVTQNPIIFPGTILENITYGCPEADMQHVLHVAELATAHDFIEHLPQGYATCVGENGTMLSGGECQRIALARALLRQPKLLILDEPTNHLDAESVRHLVGNLKTLPYGPAIVIISHDMTIVREAESIFMLIDGRIVTRGDYSTLFVQEEVTDTISSR